MARDRARYSIVVNEIPYPPVSISEWTVLETVEEGNISSPVRATAREPS